jgi:histidinol-phosphate aminotransferase
MNSKKFSHFAQIKKIYRKENFIYDRTKYIRLDKNERINNFQKYFLNKIKSKLNSNTITTYPNLKKLYVNLGKSLNLSFKNIIITNGSDLAIKNCFELITRRNSKVITLNPTYGMVDVYCKNFLVNQIKVDCNEDLTFDVNEILKKINKNISLVIIANPNSPTGKIITKKDIQKIVSKSKKNNCYILIDECYFHYSKSSVSNLITKYDNLIICRSFSKIGLAGCRIGIIITNSKLRNLLYKFRPFYEISSFSALVLEIILKNKKIFKDYVNETLKGKKIVEEYLKSKKINYFPSKTNFMLFNLQDSLLTKKLFKIFRKNLFLVNMINISKHKNLIKFTLGPEFIMKKFIKVINKTVN